MARKTFEQSLIHLVDTVSNLTDHLTRMETRLRLAEQQIVILKESDYTQQECIKQVGKDIKYILHEMKEMGHAGCE